VAEDLVHRVRGLQVWAVERREQAFEDTSVLERGDPDTALAYYLQGQPIDGRTFRPPPASEVRFMARWGSACCSATCARWCAGRGPAAGA